MAVIGTTATLEASFASGAKGFNRVTKTLTGAAASDSTALLALVADTQHHVVNGVISVGGACVVTILSGATELCVLDFVAAGFAPFPSVYSQAGEALNIKKSTAVEINVYVEIDSLTDGINDPAAQ